VVKFAGLSPADQESFKLHVPPSGGDRNCHYVSEMGPKLNGQAEHIINNALADSTGRRNTF
jgi:hypothetical protein